MRKTETLSISKQYQQYLQNPVDCGFGSDQSFLSVYVYPYVRSLVLAHIGGGAAPFARENFVTIPFPTTDKCYCGRVESLSFTDAPPAATYSFLKTKR